MMCLATLAACAVFGSAHKERDDRQTISVQGNQVAVPLEGDLRALRMESAICDGQHCDIDTAASVEPDDGSKLAAALWLLREPMYVPASDEVAAVTGRQRAIVVEALPIAPPPSVQSSGVNWRTLIEQWDDWSPEIMLRILDCESHGDPSAVSPDGRNYGGWQENVVHGYSVEQMTDPVTSTAIAHDVWLSQGYRAWSCY